MDNNNQNLPVEYENILAMTQKESSVRKGILAMKQKIYTYAGEEFNSWTEEKKDNFLEKTIITIAKDKKLENCFNSPEGKLSIIDVIEKSVSTGLEIGGKHAYLIPQNRYIKVKNQKDKKVTEIRFSIRDVGYYALLCGGKRPIFLDLRWNTVYEKDECTVDSGTGIVNHKKCLTDRGKIIGCWVQCKKINGQLEVDFFPKEKIDQWMKSSKTEYEDRPWEKWYDEMAIQASIRHFCSKYAEARELIASAIYDDINGDPDTEEKSSVENIDEALNKTTEKEEEKKEPVKAEKKPEKKDEGKELDIF